MPFYLLQASYSTESVAAMVQTPQDREAAARPVVEAVGGTLHHLFFSFGDHDIVALIEAPDDAAMAAGVMVVGASGSMSGLKTTKLFSASQAMQAMQTAQGVASTYKPASG